MCGVGSDLNKLPQYRHTLHSPFATICPTNLPTNRATISYSHILLFVYVCFKIYQRFHHMIWVGEKPRTELAQPVESHQAQRTWGFKQNKTKTRRLFSSAVLAVASWQRWKVARVLGMDLSTRDLSTLEDTWMGWGCILSLSIRQSLLLWSNPSTCLNNTSKRSDGWESHLPGIHAFGMHGHISVNLTWLDCSCRPWSVVPTEVRLMSICGTKSVGPNGASRTL